MYDELIRDILHSVLESISITQKRFESIYQPDDFISTEQGRLVLDSLAIRLQHIGESIKKLYQKHPDLFKNHPEVKWEEIIQF